MQDFRIHFNIPLQLQVVLLASCTSFARQRTKQVRFLTITGALHTPEQLSLNILGY